MMRRAALVAALASLSGCASIIQGTHTDVDIHTRPENAQIWVDGVQQGASPTKVSMEVGATHVVVVRAPGYKEQTIRTDRMLSGGYVALDILLGLLPALVDAATGAWYEVQPSPINVMLSPEGGEPVTASAAPPPAKPAARAPEDDQ
jgi:hypothetical protein